MPRPNALRDIYAEAHLARRIAVERERRGWTYEGLAKRMTDAGCSIHASAIYKIEKSDPPRRITVDELVGFSRAFGLPVDQMLVPPEMAKSEAVVSALKAWWAAYVRRMEAQHEEKLAEEALRALIADDPPAQAFLRSQDFFAAFAGDPIAVGVAVDKFHGDRTFAAFFKERWMKVLERDAAQYLPEDDIRG